MVDAHIQGFLNTPPLWNGEFYDVHQFSVPSHPSPSFEPKPVITKIRFGHQMESVYKQLIEDSEDYHLLIHNLQIHGSKKTLGEIDFILKHIPTGKLLHVELTYKFYVIDPAISEPAHRLIGPNRRDLFIRKMTKIKNVQFPLLHSEVASKALHSHSIDHLQVEHQCCFKAQLFHPFQHRNVDIGSLNRDCLAGFWIQSDVFKSIEFSKAQYYLPSKSEWVLNPTEQVIWKSHVEISKEINQSLENRFSPMLWMRNSSNHWTKLFVVWW